MKGSSDSTKAAPLCHWEMASELRWMDRFGNGSLSPAFDMTYSFNPAGKWTASHQMTMNGKLENFTIENFKGCAKVASMKRGRAGTIVNEVLKTVSRWRDYADEAGVFPSWRDRIQHTLRLKDF